MALPDGDTMMAHEPEPSPSFVSKRDKKKSMLSDRLGDMISQFSSNLRPHYEAQANALQVDITLITRANPYENKPLDDNPEEVDKMVYGMVNNQIPASPVAEDDFIAAAGKRYTEFVHDVNNSMEQRDCNLSLLASKHDNTKEELTQRYLFHTLMAREEHKFLKETIRKRLIARLNTKRNQLLREKEQLDIGESNALSLNPNQFTFANPSSPGAGNKRATRNTGRRGGNADDGAMAIDNRKRKAMNDDIEGQSPPPPSLRFDAVSTGKDARSKAVYHQFEAPSYSLDRLFTANELSMSMDKAAEAASKFFAVSIRNGELPTDLSKIPENLDEPSNEAEADDESIAAPEMERTISQSLHQTRGATRNAAQNETATAVRELPGRVAMPTFIPVVIGAKSAAGPAAPPPLTQAEIDADLTVFSRDTVDTIIVRKALQQTPSMEYQYRANSSTISHLIDSHEGSMHPSFGGIPMSTQTSVAGLSEGDAPMSRQGSTMGGVGMKRTASSTGSHLGVPDRRVRGRLG